MVSKAARVGYFTMEIGLERDVPTYSGGLGLLAGDHVRAAADMGLPLVAVSLLYRKGYFRQSIDREGTQHEAPVQWSVEEHCTPLGPKVTLTLEGRTVTVGAWRYDVTGHSGHVVPVVLLDTDLPENDEGDRTLTHALYAGDRRYRLLQEAVLGIGGLRMLHALGHTNLHTHHMNEGHAALLVLELLRERSQAMDVPASDAAAIAAVKGACVFTTHTPVAAGHDVFESGLVRHVLDGTTLAMHDAASGAGAIPALDGQLNMTRLGFGLSRFVNGVAKRHAIVSQKMFNDPSIRGITNGVHAATWAATATGELFDRFLPGWREDNAELRRAVDIPPRFLLEAHERNKKELIQYANAQHGAQLREDAFTIAFARRATAYKRADLVLDDPHRLRRIAREVGPFQLVFGGKAHPHDGIGKDVIRHIVRTLADLSPEIPALYVPDYDIELCRLMVSGSDLWLNTPQPPLEASGTSGMKAAVNGVPMLSTMDGWWIEGCSEGVNGWSIGRDEALTDPEITEHPTPERRAVEAQDLLGKLEYKILPKYYGDRAAYARVMRNAIALNGAHFTAQRMVADYAAYAYFV